MKILRGKSVKRNLKNLRPALLIAVILAFAGYGNDAAAQGVFAYPKASQSLEQQNRDKGECQQWAMQQSGFNPFAPPPVTGYEVAPPPPSTSSGFFGRRSVGQGGVFGDAAKGAGLGAIGGAIAGDAGKGAAIGSAAGALFGGIKRRSREQERQAWEHQRQQQIIQQQQQAAAQQQQGAALFNRAFAACMNARNYQVQ